MTELTRMVLEYQRTGLGLERVYAMAARIVYDYPRRRQGFNEDDSGEFLIFFHRNLMRLFLEYRDTGRPFEAYLYATLKWQLRSFRRRRGRSAQHYYVMNHRDLWEDVSPRYGVGQEDGSLVFEHPPKLTQSELFEVDADGRLLDPTMRRRVLILSLKACLYVDPVMTAAVAAAVGESVPWLDSRLARARRSVGHRTERLRALQARRLTVYIKLRHVHSFVTGRHFHPEIESMAGEVDALHRRLRNLDAELRRVPRAPTNQVIAEILGLPKGTVDSSLFYLKRLLRENPSAGAGQA